MSFVQVITFILRAFFRGRVALVLESLLLCQQLAVLRVPFVGGRQHLPVVLAGRKHLPIVELEKAA